MANNKRNNSTLCTSHCIRNDFLTSYTNIRPDTHTARTKKQITSCTATGQSARAASSMGGARHAQNKLTADRDATIWTTTRCMRQRQPGGCTRLIWNSKINWRWTQNKQIWLTKRTAVYKIFISERATSTGEHNLKIS